jgi:endogenous inhibitor of DNA gyrase (YacG/DUF329 family)
METMNMSLQCPLCGARVSWLKAVRRIRRASFPCVQCGAPLALDRRGRTTMLASIAASVVVSAVVKQEAASVVAGLITLCVGILAGCLVTWRLGRLGSSEEGRRRPF